jgi:urease accessory protein
MRKHLPAYLAVSALLVAADAAAHPGHAASDAGMFAGFLHPLTGIDHFVAMVVVGIWATQLGGRALWALPLSFLAMMAIGAALSLDGGAADIAAPTVESGIAASLLVLGAAVAWTRRLPLPFVMLLTGSFAVFHGVAHARELPAFAEPFRYTLGFLAATSLLHASGIAIGLLLQRSVPVAARVVGVTTAVTGFALLIG